MYSNTEYYLNYLCEALRYTPDNNKIIRDTINTVLCEMGC